MPPVAILLLFFLSALLPLIPCKERSMRMGFFGMVLIDAIAILALAIPHLSGVVAVYAPLATLKVDFTTALCLLAFASMFMMISLFAGFSWADGYKKGVLSRIMLMRHITAFFLCGFFLLLTLLADALPLVIIGMVGALVTCLVHGVRGLPSPDWKGIERCVRLSSIGLLFVIIGYGAVSTAIFLAHGEWAWTYTMLADMSQITSIAAQVAQNHVLLMKLGFLLSSMGLLLVAGLVPFLSVFFEKHRVFAEPLRTLIMLFLPIISLVHMLRLGYVLDVVLQQNGWVLGVYLFVGIVLFAYSFLLVWHKSARFAFVHFLQMFLIALFFLTASTGPAGIIAALMLLPTMLFGVGSFLLSVKNQETDEQEKIEKVPILVMLCAPFPFLFFSLGYGLQQEPGWVIFFTVISLGMVMKAFSLYAPPLFSSSVSHDGNDLYTLYRVLVWMLVAVHIGFALWLLTPQGLQVFVQAASSLAAGL